MEKDKEIQQIINSLIDLSTETKKTSLLLEELVDLISSDKIEAWETDDGSFIVLNTHDLEKAWKLYLDYMEVFELDSNDLLTEDDFISYSSKLFVLPDAVYEENWTNKVYSEYKEGYVPFIIVSY